MTIPQPAPTEPHVLWSLELVEEDSTFWGATEGGARNENDAPRRGGGFPHEGEEFLDEQGVAEMVGGELEFIAVGGEGGRESHDAGVAEEDVEVGKGGEEGGSGGGDGGKGGEIAGEEGYGERGGDGLDGGDGGCGGGGVAPCEEEVCGVVRGEREEGCGADARGSC